MSALARDAMVGAVGSTALDRWRRPAQTGVEMTLYLGRTTIKKNNCMC
ncbi:hypothetical protein [Euzebya sp.]